MKQTVKWLADALIALGLKQAVWADDVSDFKETLQVAEQGNAEAQFNLGLMYDNGQGVRQDYAQAVQWFGKAAEQGLANAQYNLGVMYANGEGIHQSYKIAKEWFGKACDNGLQQGCDAYQELNQQGY